MSKPKPPRSAEQANILLAQYAANAAALAAIEQRRNRMTARANAAADAKAAPLVEAQAGLFALLQTWWKGSGAEAAPKGRKSLQLGGCVIGTKAGAGKLVHGFESDDEAVAALMKTRHKGTTLKQKWSLDRKAIAKLIELKQAAGKAIAALGFRVDKAETFYIDPVEQTGGIGA